VTAPAGSFSAGEAEKYRLELAQSSLDFTQTSKAG
jgi:hypothetical protein